MTTRHDRTATQDETAVMVLNPLLSEIVRSLVLILIAVALILGLFPAVLNAAQAASLP